MKTKRKALRDLEAEWRRRLADSGFEDIEIPDASGGRDMQLKTDVRTDQASRLVREGAETEEYYRRAAHVLSTHTFPEGNARRIWELHADGRSYLEISRELGVTIRRVRTVVVPLARLARGPGRRMRGRPRNDNSSRSHGLGLSVRVYQQHALALDHIKAALKVSASEAIRRALLALAGRL